MIWRLRQKWPDSNKTCSGKPGAVQTGYYYYGARYYSGRHSRWLSADPAGSELINPMDGNGKMRSDFNLIESVNWYSYVGNNPVKYMDPTGMLIKDVPSIMMSSGTGNLGNTNTKISEKGCVLTAYTRIASAIAGKEFTLDEANKMATSNGLIDKKGEMTIANGAKLIEALTGKKIGFKSEPASGGTLQAGIDYLNKQSKEYYVTGRMHTESGDGSEQYDHTVNIVDSLDVGDYIMGKDSQPIKDTSGAGRKYEGEKRNEKMYRYDYFYVEE